ncbi:methyl-accepting chemotaxis protein [Noviherbaspirillum pedocola]|uniref:MCP four helix bundle domain-containing protein n=1 Tax=Noviherbaspirillum pedocola TaxID=2801341 RepID=A0A934SRL8_9BURK|nr:methyl-accepting chemotaxis protein [Noviherbaspirillum pedocola]MBK4735315.1 MCP four helix bundle domain-containing protein [Noviherbaspirillum pedocola]
MKLNNLKIGTRLALAFGTICLLLVGIILFSAMMLSRVNANTTDIVDLRLPRIQVSYALGGRVNDVALALRNLMLARDKADAQKQIETIAAARREINANYEELKKLIVLPKGKDILKKMMESQEQYVVKADRLIAIVNSGTADEARAYLNSDLRPVLASYKSSIAEMIEFQVELTRKSGQDAERGYHDTRNLLLGIGAAIVALAAFLGFRITRSITRPLAQALEVANTVADGDLSSRIEVRTSDETGMLLAALKRMNESLVTTVTEIRRGTESIATASAEVASGTQDLSSRTEQQASSLEETASSMEELTSTVKQNADNARQANALAESASTFAAKGGTVISEVVDTMAEINESARKVVDIISVIDGIAFQTNILALNAAVEAARAGEQGRGFAVVASEVRTLAQRSANAAKEIKMLIDTSVEKVDRGSRLVGEAGTTMNDIVQSVQHVTDIMAEITAASAEQTAGIEQINTAVAQMDQVTQQNAALVEEAAAATESMQEQAGRLAQAVAVFRVDGAQHVVVQQLGARAAPAPALSGRSKAPALRHSATGSSAPKRVAAGGDWEEF